MLKSFQVEGWDGFHLVEWAQRKWDRPVVIANDAATAGLAEAMLGAGRGVNRIFYLTIGSGIGGGWIVDGRIDPGQGTGMAELGHTYVPDPQSGAPVELESICSGWAIGQRARAAVEQEPSRMLELVGAVGAIDARTVYAAAEVGDPVATRILYETTATLGLALANVVALFRPRMIVIGGGVSLMGPLFWDGLRTAGMPGAPCRPIWAASASNALPLAKRWCQWARSVWPARRQANESTEREACHILCPHRVIPCSHRTIASLNC